MEIKGTDTKVLQGLITNLKALERFQSKTGWFESSRYESGRSVAAVAAGNEFGIPSRSIPPRPFMRPTAQEKGKSWAAAAVVLAKRVIEGKASAEDAMEILALKAEGDVSKAISELTAPPLSPITIMARAYRQKGKDVTGATIGEIAGKIKNQRYDVTASQLAGVSTKPLVDTALMINSLTHIVEPAS